MNFRQRVTRLALVLAMALSAGVYFAGPANSQSQQPTTGDCPEYHVFECTGCGWDENLNEWSCEECGCVLGP
jgi:hypothetical protein